MTSETALTDGPPDVVIVVLDCIRADLFDLALNDPARMGFLRRLSAEVVRFDRAIAPGSWTIPSHASLFTGLYPWDHRATYRTGLVLSPKFATIAGFLAGRGYATASFSGNALVQPGTGLTRGFSHALWAGDREFFLRFVRTGIPSCRSLYLPGAEWLESPNVARESALLGTLGNLCSRSLAFWDCINRVGTRVTGLPSWQAQVVAGWIEPELSRWLSSVPRHQPAFAFINFIEAHEPYLLNGGDSIDAKRWLRSLPMGNAPERWLAGRGTPSPAYLSEVRASYMKTLDALDRRVGVIVDAFRTRRNWRNTIFVLTSDHGQSLGEDGLVGHRMLVGESLTRVPLWIKPGRGQTAPARRTGWCSLTDVATTITSAVSGEHFGDEVSHDLLAESPNGEGRAVYVVADGITHHEARGMRPESRGLLDRTRIAVYHGTSKVVVEDGKVSSVEEPVGSKPRPIRSKDEEDPRALTLESSARERLRLISTGVSGTASKELNRRLTGWGY